MNFHKVSILPSTQTKKQKANSPLVASSSPPSHWLLSSHQAGVNKSGPYLLL